MDEWQLPDRPFFSCEPDGLAVVDGEQMRRDILTRDVVPLFRFLVGPGNLFEQAPRKVVHHEGSLVSVECDGGCTVHLDFAQGTGRVERADGEFLYRGALDEACDGLGFIAAR